MIVSTIDVLDAEITALEATLSRLRAARDILSGLSPTAVAAPRAKPGPEPGNSQGPRDDRPKPAAPESERVSKTVENVRAAILNLLTNPDHAAGLTPGQMASMLNLKVWKVSDALKDWPEVVHSDLTNYKSPYVPSARSTATG